MVLKILFINEPFGLCVDIENQAVIGRTHYRTEGIRTYTINKNLKTYLEYLYTYICFRNEVKIPQTLGQYHLHHEKYALELKKRLMALDKDDVNTDFWYSCIGEWNWELSNNFKYKIWVSTILINQKIHLKSLCGFNKFTK